MAYAVVADVQALINTNNITIGTDTPPSTAEVTAWLDQWSDVIDGILTAHYATVPVTGTNDLNILLPYVAMRVAYDTWVAHYPNATTHPDFVMEWKRRWEWFLDMLSSRKIKLIDQSPSTSLSVVLPKVYGAS